MDKNTAKGWMYSSNPRVLWERHKFSSATTELPKTWIFMSISPWQIDEDRHLDVYFLQMIWEYHSVKPRSLEYWNDSVSIIDHWKQPPWSFKTMLDCQGLTSAPLQTSWICFCYNLHNKNPKLSINYPMNPGTFFLKMVPEKPPNRYIPNSSS